MLQNLTNTDSIIVVIWVWLSLVERLNGVQEAAGSIPVTQTKN